MKTADRAAPAIRAWRRVYAAAFGIPLWMIGGAKRPPQPKVRGQRGTGHHRPRRR